jgi:hypothetical protein
MPAAIIYFHCYQRNLSITQAFSAETPDIEVLKHKSLLTQHPPATFSVEPESIR